MTAIYRDLDEMLGASLASDAIWFLPEGRHRDELERYFTTRDPETLFGRMAELNDYTRVVSPGILKRACVKGKPFVVKSVPAEETAVQHNELKSALAILDVVNRLAPSSVARLGFDVTVIVPEAVCRTRTGRILSVMLLHPYPALDAILIRCEGRPDDMREHLENIRTLYDFFSHHGIFWQDMAPRNILVDGNHASLHYVILDFEKTRTDVGDLAAAETGFWRGAVISEEFLSVCGTQAVAGIFGDKYDPSSWDTLSTEIMPGEAMRREIACIVRHNAGRAVTVGEYNRLDRLLAATRPPVRDGSGRMCFFTDHILGPAYDRRLNEIFLVAQANGRMDETCGTVHDAMISAGAGEMVCRTGDGRISFEGDVLRDCIDALYAQHVGEDRTIERLLGPAAAS